MSRRDRIRARLIYRRWSIFREVRWSPPFGWITKVEQLSRLYRFGAKPILRIDLPPMTPEQESRIAEIMRRKQEQFDRMIINHWKTER